MRDSPVGDNCIPLRRVGGLVDSFDRLSKETLMPRAQNPIANLNALELKADQLAQQRAELERDAHAFIGKLAFDAGLKGWDVKDIKAGMKHLADLGPEAVRKPGKPKTASPATDASAVAAVAAE